MPDTPAADPRPIAVLNRWSIAIGYGAVFYSLAAGSVRRRRISGKTCTPAGFPPAMGFIFSCRSFQHPGSRYSYMTQKIMEVPRRGTESFTSSEETDSTRTSCQDHQCFHRRSRIVFVAKHALSWPAPGFPSRFRSAGDFVGTYEKLRRRFLYQLDFRVFAGGSSRSSQGSRSAFDRWPPKIRQSR